MWVLDCHTLHGLTLTLEALMLVVLTDVMVGVQWELLPEVLLAIPKSVVRLLVPDLQMVWVLLYQMLSRGVPFTVCLYKLVFLSNHVFTRSSLVLVLYL